MSFAPSAKAISIASQIAANLAGASSPGPWTAMQSGTVSQLPQQAVADAYLNALSTNTFIDIGSGGSAPAFGSGWGNYGSGYNNCSFLKDASGVVHLRGLANGTPTTQATIFTLPVGYRPVGTSIFIVGMQTSGYGRVDVFSNGIVQINGAPAGLLWVSLEQIHFVGMQ
jgi:hypothetical protein